MELYKAAKDLRAVIVCYTEAVKTVDPFQVYFLLIYWRISVYARDS